MVNVNYFHKDLLPNTGFENSTITGNQFDFNGTYLTAGWNDGLNIEVTGFLNNALLFTQTVVVNTSAAQWFDFNFLGINSLSMRAWGSTSIDGTVGNDFFIIDNFTTNKPTAVPESSSLALLLLGVARILLGRKTKKA